VPGGSQQIHELPVAGSPHRVVIDTGLFAQDIDLARAPMATFLPERMRRTAEA
jgi:hypothetical protein